MSTEYYLYFRGQCHEHKEQAIEFAIRKATQAFIRRGLTPRVAIIPAGERGQLNGLKTIKTLDAEQQEIELAIETSEELKPLNLQISNKSPEMVIA